MEETSLDKLKAIARRSGRHLEFRVNTYKPVQIQPITYHRRVAYMEESPGSGLYFAAFADSREFGKLSCFAGVFIATDINSNVQARSSDILDKVNFKLRARRIRTGRTSFDRKVILTGTDKEVVNRHFGNHKAQDWCMDAILPDPRYRFGINSVDLDFVPDLKEVPVAGIYVIGTWPTEREEIERMFTQMKKYRELSTAAQLH